MMQYMEAMFAMNKMIEDINIIKLEYNVISSTNK